MTFEWPALLLALGLIPVLMALYVLAQRRRRAYAVRFTNLALLRDVAGRGPGIRRHIPPLLFLFGLAALLVSLARPYAVLAVPRDQTAIMLVMDVSGSMSAEDLQPNRLEAAKRAARAFVDKLPANAQVGLVTFSTSASVNAPLVRDADTVRRSIGALSPDGGTAIGDGLRLALDQLAQRPADEHGERAPALVVLLSDGQQTNGQTTPEEASAHAQQQGVTVHTVGVGLRGATPRIMGLRGPARLDETTLQRVAERTGGQYFYAAEASQLERIYADLGSRVSWVEERTEVTALATAAGTLLLVAAGLLSLRWFHRLP
jgi:Ca-activated chloride channel family protein